MRKAKGMGLRAWLQPGEWLDLRRCGRWAMVTSFFTLTVLCNELGFNLWFFFTRLRDAKVLQELSAETELVSRLWMDGVVMFLIVALVTAAACGVWAAISLAVFDRWRARLEAVRLGRVFFWLVNSLIFFRVWYSAHQIVLPGSRLGESPLFVAVGAMRLEEMTLPEALSRDLGVTAVALLGLLAFSILALLQSRTLRRSLAAAGLVACSGLWGYSTLTALGAATQFSSHDNVIFLGLDSFQTNRLAIGGVPENIAPNVNTFLEESLRFENAWTPLARTYPSWLSILTGRYPSENGVRFNLMPDSALDPDNSYLPEVLREAGYVTFHATDETRFSNVRARFGFDHLVHPRMGLDDWILGTLFDFSAGNLLRQTALGHDLFPAIANNRASPSYSPRLWVRTVLKRINRLPTDAPLFLALHLCGNHWPHSTPAPYSVIPGSPVERSIVMVDDQVGEILDYLKRSGLRDSSTIFMLSDHGDGFSGIAGDDYNRHGSSFDRVFANKMVLGVQRPGTERGVVSAMVRSLDLYPTVLDLAHVDSPSETSGVSLLPALEGGEVESRGLFAETGLVQSLMNIEKLVQENAKWYRVDEETGLMEIRPEKLGDLMALKSYMVLRGEHRLVVTPHTNEVALWRFDPACDCDSSADPSLPVEARVAMLRELTAHFSLDSELLMSRATAHNFTVSRPVSQVTITAEVESEPSRRVEERDSGGLERQSP